MDVELRVRASGARGVEYALRRSPARSPSSIVSRAVFRLVAAACTALGWALALAVAAASFLAGRHALSAAAAALAAVLMAMAVVRGRAIVEEGLLVVPSLGVQLRKTRRNGATATKFVDARAICGVVIHEAITFADVPYLLAFMVDGQEDGMLLAFEEFRPRIGVLQEIYRGTKRILFPPGSDGGEQDASDTLASTREMRLPLRLQALLDER